LILLSTLYNLNAEIADNLGAGGCIGTFGTGTSAIDGNPALMNSKSRFEFMSLGIDLAASNNLGIDYNQFLNLFTNNGDGIISETEKNQIVGNLQKNNHLGMTLNTCFLRFVYTTRDEKNSFGFSLSEKNHIKFDLPKDMIELALFGNTPERTYDFGNMKAEMFWYREYAFGYCRKEGNFSYGANLKLLEVYTYLKLNLDKASLYTNSDNYIRVNLKGEAYSAFSPSLEGLNPFSSSSTINYGLFNQSAGFGAALDLGCAWQINNFFRIGCALKDLGSVTLTNLEYHTMDQKAELSDLTNEAQFTGIKHLADITTVPANSDKIDLSGRVVLSGLFNAMRLLPLNEFLITADYSIYTHEPMNSDFTSILSLGTKIKFKRSLPYILAGYRMSYDKESYFSFGLGYESKRFALHLATADVVGWIKSTLNARVAFEGVISF
jgi:hypothetical protein